MISSTAFASSLDAAESIEDGRAEGVGMEVEGISLFEEVGQMIRVSSAVTTTLLALFIIYTWCMVFSSFRRHMLMLRRGVKPFGLLQGSQANASRYIGYQVAHTSFAFFLNLAFCVVLVPPLVLAFRSEGALGRSLHRSLVSTLTSLVILVPRILAPLLFQMICNFLYFFREPWLRNRPLCISARS